LSQPVPILAALQDSEQDQGQQNDQWQGGSHVLVIGGIPGGDDP
jgi:hypothetical protein